MVSLDPFAIFIIIVIGTSGIGLLVGSELAIVVMGIGILGFFASKVFPSLEGVLLDNLPALEFEI